MNSSELPEVAIRLIIKGSGNPSCATVENVILTFPSAICYTLPVMSICPGDTDPPSRGILVLGYIVLAALAVIAVWAAHDWCDRLNCSAWELVCALFR